MQISCQRGKAFTRYRGNPGRLDIQNLLECRFSVNAAPGRMRHGDEAGKALPGACAPPHKGRGRGPLAGRSRSGRARQWEGPEWSEAERSPPGVPSLPLENTKKTDPIKVGLYLIRWEKLTAPPEDEAAEHR